MPYSIPRSLLQPGNQIQLPGMYPGQFEAELRRKQQESARHFLAGTGNFAAEQGSTGGPAQFALVPPSSQLQAQKQRLARVATPPSAPPSQPARNPQPAPATAPPSPDSSSSSDIFAQAARIARPRLHNHEGLRLEAYLDPVGVPTIGYGTTRINGQPVRLGMRITREEAERLADNDLQQFLRGVYGSLNETGRRNLTPNRLAAMGSLAYNIGQGGFRRSSVLRHFNAGNIQAAADAFRLWNRGDGRVLPGLVRRREEERALFLQ